MPIEERWCEVLTELGRLVRAERTNELCGKWPSRFDSQGLHPFSLLWGTLVTIEQGAPHLQDLRIESGERPCEPLELKKVLRRDADAEWRRQIEAAVREGQELAL